MMRRELPWTRLLRRVLLVLVVGLLAGLPAGGKRPDTVQAMMAQDAAEETLCGYPVVPLDSVLDPSFGEGGEVALDPRRLGADWQFLAVDHQDRILLRANYRTDETSTTFTLGRLRADGRFDPDFGDDGQITHTLPVANFAAGLDKNMIASDGSLVLSGLGTMGPPSSDTWPVLVRIRPDGYRDLHFGEDGIVVLRLGVGPISPGPLDTATLQSTTFFQQRVPVTNLRLTDLALTPQGDIALIVRAIARENYYRGGEEWLLVLMRDGSRRTLLPVDALTGAPLRTADAYNFSLDLAALHLFVPPAVMGFVGSREGDLLLLGEFALVDPEVRPAAVLLRISLDGQMVSWFGQQGALELPDWPTYLYTRTLFGAGPKLLEAKDGTVWVSVFPLRGSAQWLHLGHDGRSLGTDGTDLVVNFARPGCAFGLVDWSVERNSILQVHMTVAVSQATPVSDDRLLMDLVDHDLAAAQVVRSPLRHVFRSQHLTSGAVLLETFAPSRPLDVPRFPTLKRLRPQ